MKDFAIYRIVGENDSYYLRDDQEAGLCDYERYSLFCVEPEHIRIGVFAGTLVWAAIESGAAISKHRREIGIDPLADYCVLDP